MLKYFLPKSIRNACHFFFALFGALRYGFPSKKMYVIGITGTTGKSTTITLLRQTLELAGFCVGSLSTVDFYIAGAKKINDKKMTMLGRMQIQKYLRDMVRAGCDIAIVETTSEGGVQHRHRCIYYDMMLLTNLYPEHIESHGSYDLYAKAKQRIFSYAASLPRKHLVHSAFPQMPNGTLKKIAIIPIGVDFHDGFIDSRFDEIISFGNGADFEAKHRQASKEGLVFSVSGHPFYAPMYGEHNIDNMLCVMAIARSFGIAWDILQKSVATFHNVEGRCELIQEAEPLGFQVIVDYAFEPVALQKLYDVVALLQPKRVLHVCGSTGGGRDKARRVPIGNIVGEKASIVYITDEDPYDENPLQIMRDVEKGAEQVGKVLGTSLFEIIDRREAIFQAIFDAQAGDIVLITGKGSEQAMCVAHGNMIPWDDRLIAREAIKKRMHIM